MSARRIAITGGIGAGKSVVCRMLRAMGYSVYDCDTRARQIMDAAPEIKNHIRRHIHPDAVDNLGRIDRRLLAEIVFNDEDRRLALNAAVHQAVRLDFRQWCAAHEAESVVFVECAILCESHMDTLVNNIWLVTAPDQQRIERICLRNGITPEEAQSRIAAQAGEAALVAALAPVLIANDGTTPILPRIEHLLHTTA